MPPAAPGELVVTETCGGTISGYWATGIAKIETSPAVVATRGLTIPSRGRSTKIAESIGLSPAHAWIIGRGPNRGARSKALQALDDDLLAPFESRGHDDVRRAFAAGLDGA